MPGQVEGRSKVVGQTKYIPGWPGRLERPDEICLSHLRLEQSPHKFDTLLKIYIKFVYLVLLGGAATLP